MDRSNAQDFLGLSQYSYEEPINLFLGKTLNRPMDHERHFVGQFEHGRFRLARTISS